MKRANDAEACGYLDNNRAGFTGELASLCPQYIVHDDEDRHGQYEQPAGPACDGEHVPYAIVPCTNAIRKCAPEDPNDSQCEEVRSQHHDDGCGPILEIGTCLARRRPYQLVQPPVDGRRQEVVAATIDPPPHGWKNVRRNDKPRHPANQSSKSGHLASNAARLTNHGPPREGSRQQEGPRRIRQDVLQGRWTACRHAPRESRRQSAKSRTLKRATRMSTQWQETTFATQTASRCHQGPMFVFQAKKRPR